MKPKLLIVDDEHGIVDMIQRYFQTQYDILTAYSGQEALKKVICKPDLILLDINMPGMDGLTVCQKLLTTFVPSGFWCAEPTAIFTLVIPS